MLRTDTLSRLADVTPAAWDALIGDDNPFLQHAFLDALEQSGSVGSRDTGWVPRHVVVYDGDRLVGALPLYEKYDSYGEYIFDWAWANASHQNGIPYYPKVVSAIPFTPATGRRLLHADAATLPGTCTVKDITDALLQGARAVGEHCGASSIHVLFNTADESSALTNHGFMPRLSYQFHWDRDPSWHTFDDYLAALRAPARKQVRRERATAASHGLQLSMQRGTALNDADWDALYLFYRHTAAEKGAITYLTEAFFTLLRQKMGHNVVAALAHDGTRPVAGALYLTRGQHLYGRYWGSFAAYDALHFELCYYAPIAWGLTHGIEHFEAGAQGEHKLKRGLLPSPCHSGHWIRHPGLAEAIGRFLQHETEALGADITAMMAHTPFPRTGMP